MVSHHLQYALARRIAKHNDPAGVTRIRPRRPAPEGGFHVSLGDPAFFHALSCVAAVLRHPASREPDHGPQVASLVLQPRIVIQHYLQGVVTVGRDGERDPDGDAHRRPPVVRDAGGIRGGTGRFCVALSRSPPGPENVSATS